jgi:hypothetical protein
MIDHVILTVSEFKRSVAFYAEALKPLGVTTLPVEYKYDERTGQLDVEWGDGSVIRYLDISPSLAFVSDTNPRRNRDFLDYLEYEWALNFVDILVKVKRRVPVKQEVLQEATKQIGESQTRPLLAAQQNGVNSQQKTLTFPNTGNRT